MKILAGIAILFLLVPLQALSAGWKYSKSVDEIDDSVTHFASVSFKAYRNREGFVNVRCNGSTKQVDVYFSSGAYLTNYDKARVDYRFDSHDAVQAEFWMSNSSKAVFVNEKNMPNFIGQLRSGNRLLARLYNYKGQASDIKVSLAGSKVVIDKALAPCGEIKFTQRSLDDDSRSTEFRDPSKEDELLQELLENEARDLEFLIKHQSSGEEFQTAP